MHSTSSPTISSPHICLAHDGIQKASPSFLFRIRFADPSQVCADPDWTAMETLVGKERAGLARINLNRILDDWCDVFGLSKDLLSRTLDIEDFIENAVMLLAADRLGLPLQVLTRDGKTVSTTRPEPLPDQPLIFFGTLLRNEPLLHGPARLPEPSSSLPIIWPREGRLPGGGEYWRSPVLLAALGRAAHVTSGNCDGPDGYGAAVASLVESGAKAIKAKIIFRDKYQPVSDIVLDILPDGRPDLAKGSLMNAFYEAFDATMYDCADRRICFLVQEKRSMRHEYRIVVVDGRAVAGAGCIEALCPIYHDACDGAFDSLVENVRGDGIISSLPDLVARYRVRADEILAKLEEAGDIRFRDCVMDFAYDADCIEGEDDILLVETNPCTNYGLYALDFHSVLAGVVGSVETEQSGAR